MLALRCAVIEGHLLAVDRRKEYAPPAPKMDGEDSLLLGEILSGIAES
jgi:hypothetical protein